MDSGGESEVAGWGTVVINCISHTPLITRYSTSAGMNWRVATTQRTSAARIWEFKNQPAVETHPCSHPYFCPGTRFPRPRMRTCAWSPAQSCAVKLLLSLFVQNKGIFGGSLCHFGYCQMYFRPIFILLGWRGFWCLKGFVCKAHDV